jgi:predicted outer membrane repeat protein
MIAHQSGTVANYTNCTFEGGYARYGGALCIRAGTTVIDGCTFKNNKAINGGAIYVDYGKLCVKGGNIVGNKVEYGGAIYCNDLDDAFICIEGGKFVGNKATEDGGAIYMYDGYLDITGGEISGNTAKNGAGIYWESDNAAFLIGGKIINNNAIVNGGVYVETNGDVYVGGDVTITGNGNGNLYLYNGACISNACGQDGAPNNPLSESARIGISATDKEELISKDDSMFGEADFDVIFSDSNGYFIRSVYDAEDEGHEHKLYINSWGHEDARYPRVKTVSVKNSDMIESATIDYDEQIITLKVSANNKEALRSAALTNLISYTCDKDIYYIDGADKNRDLTTVQKYKTMSDNGTYVMVIVQVEWICSEHTDADNDYVCDDCKEYVFSDTTIIDYNAETKETTVLVTKPGRYSLIFADYENETLKNVDIVEYDFAEGINVVPQKVTSFALASGDKVMLWYDMINLVPICEALTIK